MTPRKRITTLQEIKVALRNTEEFSSDLQGDSDVRNYRQLPLEVDPPRHHLYRTLLSELFVRPRIQSLQPQFEEIAEALIDEFESNGGGNFVEDVSTRYVVTCLGVIFNRPQDVDEWISWGPDVWTADGPERDGTRLHTYLHRVYEEGVVSNQQDAWSYLAKYQLEDRGITFEEFKGMSSVMLAGGRDTVIKLISGATMHLLQNPVDRSALESGEVTLKNAIQEFLRYFSPLPSMYRVAPDQQDLPDEKRNPELFVEMAFAEANHDPSAFQHPEIIDIRREKIQHVAFGFGPHTCIGNHIAEIETLTILQILLKRLSGWVLRSPAVLSMTATTYSEFPSAIHSLDIKVT